jgi:predicted nucleotide-binding protein (sugar kinase/HSP70/actin superfamily)
MSPVIVYKKLLEMLGHEVIMPPTPTQKTIDLGVKYSPEFACFPLKVIMGSYIEAIEKGAEAIVTSGGNGPCRAGYYGELHHKILKNLGYDVDIIVIDAIFPHFADFMGKVLKLKGKSSIGQVVKAIRVAGALVHAVDDAEKRLQVIRAYEVNEGDCLKVWDEVIKIYDSVYSLEEIKTAKIKVNEIIDAIPVIKVDEKDKIRVGIVGEIYVVMETSVNMEIEKLLGKMGVETERSQYLSDWVDYNMVPAFLRDKKVEKVMEKGKQYIEIQIGGHAVETVGFIKDFKDRGFDGIIHLMPFGCLPELVTQSIAPEMSVSLDMPILTMAIDEQTGKANNLTRIEAFIDLIRSKKGFSKKKDIVGIA